MKVRNEICIRLEMREALLDMRTFKYNDEVRYKKVLRKYNKLCNEIDKARIVMSQ